MPRSAAPRQFADASLLRLRQAMRAKGLLTRDQIRAILNREK